MKLCPSVRAKSCSVIQDVDPCGLLSFHTITPVVRVLHQMKPHHTSYTVSLKSTLTLSVYSVLFQTLLAFRFSHLNLIWDLRSSLVLCSVY